VSGQYTNEHLPDLRAKFVEQDLVTPYLNDCKEKRNTQVHIIKGYEFKTELWLKVVYERIKGGVFLMSCSTNHQPYC
jgi:hypothetical protein